MRQCAIAASLLFVLLVGQVAWKAFDGVAQWWIWDASQALLLAGALAALTVKASPEVRPVLGLGVGLNVLGGGASLWWAFAEVQPEPGQESFDALIGWPASLLVMFVFVVCAHIIRETKK